MLRRCCCGEAVRQILSTGTPRQDETTQWREAVVFAAENGNELMAPPNRPLHDPDFLFELVSQFPDDPAHRRPVSPGRFRMRELSPGVGEWDRDRL